eukprot:3100696-Pleurochrysis_carterae.AAC.2
MTGARAEALCIVAHTTMCSAMYRTPSAAVHCHLPPQWACCHPPMHGCRDYEKRSQCTEMEAELPKCTYQQRELHANCAVLCQRVVIRRNSWRRDIGLVGITIGS